MRKKIMPKQPDKVHFTRFYPKNSSHAALAYCGIRAMRCSDQKAIVTCKSCLRLMKTTERKALALQEAKIKYEKSLGLTEAEQGTSL